MIYYEVEGWILPSEKEEKTLTQSLISRALLTLMKREYEQQGTEEANKSLLFVLQEYMTRLPNQFPTMYWGQKEEPSQAKMEDFLTELLEQTEQGQMLLRASGQEITPIPKEETYRNQEETYRNQEEMDDLTLSQMLMELPTPGTEGDHGDNWSGWTDPYVN